MASKYFSDRELSCRCGCGLMIGPELVEKLDAIREGYGSPLVLSSAARCFEHNKSVGGAPGSAHLDGRAADIADPDGSVTLYVLSRLDDLDIYIEDPRFTKGWIHVQTRPSKARIFTPGKKKG